MNTTEQNSGPAGKERLRWLSMENAPARKAGKGYTRFVRLMRILLPLAAVGIIGLIMSWPQLEETMEAVPKEAVIPQSVGKNELVDPRFESKDSKNQPFTLTARRALQSAHDPDVVLLEAPMADIIMNDGTWLAAEADQGAYRQEAERLLLEGNVKLFHDQGYEVKTEKLLVNLKNRNAWSDQPVHGQGPAGTLDASGMQAHSDRNQLIFTGPVKLVLNRSIKGL